MKPNRLLLALLSLLRPPGMAANPSPLLSFCLRSSLPRAAASSPGASSFSGGPTRRSPIGDALRRTAVDPRRRRGRGLSRLGAGGGEDASPESVAIVGGGLAGLSVAYHLVGGRSSRTEEGRRRRRVAVFDRCPVGEGGASSVAGGLIHPFSPRGKLIHMGLESLSAAAGLIDAASSVRPGCLVRRRLYRLATEGKHAAQLTKTAGEHPDLARWMTADEVRTDLGVEGSAGGLELGNGCGVVHVPTYLRGLWGACVARAEENGWDATWEVTSNYTASLSDADLSDYDAVVLAAGSGLVTDGILTGGDGKTLPIPAQLVRGQSVEISHDPSGGSPPPGEALLCGKYIAPIPDESRSGRPSFVVGATHEHGDGAMTGDEVAGEMRTRTEGFAPPSLWEGGRVDRITGGCRVQSDRGRFGRMPMVGRLDDRDGDTGLSSAIAHDNLWLFTGLSSRGLIYHGLFGRMLAAAIEEGDEDAIRRKFDEFDWWRKGIKRAEKDVTR